jgi:hypothetical protein
MLACSIMVEDENRTKQLQARMRTSSIVGDDFMNCQVNFDSTDHI